MIIRKFRDNDALECYLLYFENEIREVSKYYDKKSMWGFLKNFSPKKMISKQRMRLVAVDKGSVIGFIFVRIGKKSAYVGSLFVSVSHMGKGVGTKLYKEAEKILKSKGIRKIRLNSTISPNTLRFYEEMGFKNMGKTTVKLRGVRASVVKMEKTL